MRAGHGTPDDGALLWARSVAKAIRVRSQLLHALGRALSALTQLRRLTLVCHTVPAAALGWDGTRLLHLPRLKLPWLAELSIRPSQGRAMEALGAGAVSTEPPAFAIAGLGSQCELPSLRRFGARAAWAANASRSGPHVSVGPSDISRLFSPMAVVCVGVFRPCAQRLPAKR